MSKSSFECDRLIWFKRPNRLSLMESLEISLDHFKRIIMEREQSNLLLTCNLICSKISHLTWSCLIWQQWCKTTVVERLNEVERSNQPLDSTSISQIQRSTSIYTNVVSLGSPSDIAQWDLLGWTFLHFLALLHLITW